MQCIYLFIAVLHNLAKTLLLYVNMAIKLIIVKNDNCLCVCVCVCVCVYAVIIL